MSLINKQKLLIYNKNREEIVSFENGHYFFINLVINDKILTWISFNAVFDDNTMKMLCANIKKSKLNFISLKQATVTW
jgi:hypothetical protein